MIQTWVIMVHQFACCLNINVAIERRLLPSLHWRSRGKEGLAEMSQNRSSLEDHQHFRHLWEWLRTLNLCVLELRLFLGWSLYLLNLNSHNQSSKSATTRPRDSAIFCPMFTAKRWILINGQNQQPFTLQKSQYIREVVRLWEQSKIYKLYQIS